MRKNYWSKITWLFLGLVPLLLIACGGGATDAIVTVPPPATDEPVVPTAEPVDEPVAPAEEPVVEEPTAEVMDVVEEVEAEMEDEILPVSAKPQLIEFYADWWPTCRRMEPIVHGLEAEYDQQLDFVYYDIDAPESADAMREYNFRVQPHFLLLDAEGEVLQEWFGSVPVEQFVEAFEDTLAN